MGADPITRPARPASTSPTADTFLGESLAGPTRWGQLCPARNAPSPFSSLRTVRWGGLRCPS
eukprot:1474177-Rhodomonas_salina.1